ncbi:MAG: hypothetical protein R3310_10045 [Candidatus Competibacteraceae bacterium]|nr:hypothetical protein [Candidatus Competibacteraceae bacterium]
MFHKVLIIALAASLPLWLLYLAAEALPVTAKAPSSVVARHLRGFLVLAGLTLLLFFNNLVRLLPNDVLLLILMAGLAIVILLRVWHRPAPMVAKWVRAYGMIVLLCLVSAGIYLLPAKTGGILIPAQGNNDIFIYLLRAYGLSTMTVERIAATVGGLTPLEVLQQTSKFAGNLFLSFFLPFTQEPGTAAAAAATAVRAVLLHLFWGHFSLPGQGWRRVLLLLLLAFLPVPVLLAILFHLSQLIFIYFCALGILALPPYLQSGRYLELMVPLLWVLYGLLLYPAALPLALPMIMAITLLKGRLSDYRVDLGRLLLWATVAMLSFAGLSVLRLADTDFMAHMAGEYRPYAYLALLGQLLLPIALQPFAPASALPEPFIQQAIGLLLDTALLMGCWLALGSNDRPATRNLRWISLSLITAWIGYEILFLSSDGGYRAFKYATVFVTLGVLFLIGNWYRVHGTRKWSWQGWLILAAILINILALALLTLNRSLDTGYRALAQTMAADPSPVIYYRFESYKLNMYLPLAVPGKHLYALGPAYGVYQGPGGDDLCQRLEYLPGSVYLSAEAAAPYGHFKTLIDMPLEVVRISPQSLDCGDA